MSIRANYPNIRPSLNLDFANTKRLDPRISFSRSGSGATYVDANGVIQTAAANVPRFDHNPVTGESLGLLIEEQRTNSITYNNIFSDTSWTKTNAIIVPNTAITAPDGSATASLIYPAANGSPCSIGKGIGAVSSSAATTTVYAKAGGKNWLVLWGAQGNYVAWFNLSTGAVGTTQSGITATITSVGNGWYRCSATQTVTYYNFYVGIADADGDKSVTVSGTSGIYIWGAQLEAGSFPTSYIPTPATFTSRSTTATYYNASGVVTTAAVNEARSNAFFPDSNGVMRPAGLLLEAASTNLLNGSQTFATSGGTQNNWVDTNITRDGTLRTSPDGTANALRVTASSANATIVSSAAIGSSALRTFSIFLRRVTGTGDIQYTLDNGSTWTTQAITTSWSRYSFPATTAGQQVGIRLVTSGDAIELWGAQLEDSPYATSYIPTTTATVTRAADVSSSSTVTRSADVAQMTGTNFSSWYSNSGSTLLAYGASDNPSPGIQYIAGVGGFSDGAQIRETGTQILGMFRGTYGADANSFALPLGLRKMAIVYAPSTASLLALNGSVYVGGNSSSALTLPAGLGIGASGEVNNFWNGTVSRLTYWPTRLTNAQLQALTR